MKEQQHTLGQIAAIGKEGCEWLGRRYGDEIAD
ncbi:hypothetical protein ABID25_006518 [Mesorhizobium abyssinicae]